MSAVRTIRLGAAYALAALCLLCALQSVWATGWDALASYPVNPPGRGQLASLRTEGVDALAAWSDGGAGMMSSAYQAASARPVYAMGDVTLLLPGSLVAGHAYGGVDGALISEGLCFALFGSFDAIGQTLRFGGAAYAVQGVYRVPAAALRSVDAILPMPKDGKAQCVAVKFAPSPQSAQEHTQQLLAGIGEPASIQLPEDAGFIMNALGLLPVWAMVLGALWAAVRPVPHRKTALGVAILCALALGYVGFAPALPTAWLPTRWSELQHWPALLLRLMEDALRAPALSLACQRAAWVWALCCLVLCALGLAMRMPRVGDGAGEWLACLAPAAVLWIAWLLGLEIDRLPLLLGFAPVCAALRMAAAHLANHFGNREGIS